MLSDYIDAYIEAAMAGNKKEKLRIAKELNKLSMDNTTIAIVASERYKEMKKGTK